MPAILDSHPVCVGSLTSVRRHYKGSVYIIVKRALKPTIIIQEYLTVIGIWTQCVNMGMAQYELRLLASQSV
jgi:hypothetical protein